FVKLVRKCRDFERGASVAAFNAADTRNAGLLDDHAAALALQQLGFEGVKLPENSRVSMDLNDFLLLVARLEKERLRCLRTYFNFSPTELGNLRMEFDRVAKDGSSELKRHELPRLVEVLFPVYAHSPEFRPILVRLLKEVKLDERQAVKYMDFLQLIRTIRDETEKHQCLVYAETIRRLEFSFREASEFLSVFLSASEEAQRKLSSEDLVTLFQQCFDISERECHQLHECFLLSAKPVPSKSRSAAPTQSCSFTLKRPEESQSFTPTMGFQGPKSSEETGVDFLDFLEIMRRVIEAGLGGALLHKGSFRALREDFGALILMNQRCLYLETSRLGGIESSLPAMSAFLPECAALVAAHPMRAEVVCWSSCHGYLLASIFCLLCLRFYIWGLRYSGALLFGLAVCSKASAVTFPCALFAWELLFDEDPMVLAAARAAANLWPYVPQAVGAAVMAVVAASGAHADARPLNSLETVLRASYAPCFYLWKTFAPPWTWTTPRYDLPEKLELADFQFASALAFLAATLVFIACFAALEALGARSWSCRALCLAWATYLALLLPSLGFVSTHIWALAADRYVYLPTLCILMPCTAAVLQSLCEGRAWKCRALPVALGIVYLLSCAWRANEVACHWASGSSSLFEAILHEQPNQFNTLKDFGTLELKRGKLQKAKALLSHALRIRPDHSGLLLNIATLLHQSKETAEAEAMYRRACASAKAAVERCQGCQPAATELAKAHANYGGLLLQSGRHVDAAKLLEAGQPWDGAVDSADG
ncbi:Calmodulin, partial [Symbiodinium necroappetens]